MAKTNTRAAKNKAIRQEALREQLSKQKHAEQVIDIANKLKNEAVDLDSQMVQRLKSAADLHMKLVNKYLPDLKSSELTGEGGGPIPLSILNDFGDN